MFLGAWQHYQRDLMSVGDLELEMTHATEVAILKQAEVVTWLVVVVETVCEVVKKQCHQTSLADCLWVTDRSSCLRKRKKSSNQRKTIESFDLQTRLVGNEIRKSRH